MNDLKIKKRNFKGKNEIIYVRRLLFKDQNNKGIMFM